MRAATFTKGACAVTIATSAPRTSFSQSWARRASAVVSPGGLGDGTRISAWASATSRSRLESRRSTSRVRADAFVMDSSAPAQALLENADGEGERPADEEIHHGDEGEDLE